MNAPASRLPQTALASLALADATVLEGRGFGAARAARCGARSSTAMADTWKVDV